MIKLNWGHLRDRGFLDSLEKVFSKPMGYDIGHKLVLLGREIKKQQKDFEATHEKALKKYGTPDEKKRGYYNIPEGSAREEYAAEMDKMLAHEFKVRIAKLDPEKLSAVVADITPQDLMMLEPLLLPFEMPAVEGEENQETEQQADAH